MNTSISNTAAVGAPEPLTLNDASDLAYRVIKLLRGRAAE